MTREEAEALARLEVEYAVTLIRPWPWAIFNAGKDVENRGPRFPAPKPGTLLAIHAGVKFSEDSARDIQLLVGIMERRVMVPMRQEEHPKSAVVGVVYVDAVTVGKPYRPTGWYMGDMGIWLSKQVAIEPVPCKGQLGRWHMNMDTQDLVQQRYREALAKLAG